MTPSEAERAASRATNRLAELKATKADNAALRALVKELVGALGTLWDNASDIAGPCDFEEVLPKETVGMINAALAKAKQVTP